MRALAIVALIAACGDEPDYEPPGPHDRSMVILGIDGMDPVLIERYRDRLPNLWALAERGAFSKLATSDPPQSPVAWSTFITGAHSDHHGIYDFVHRDPRAMSPYLSTSRTYGPSRTIEIGSLALPLGSSGVELLREGDAFWQLLERAGVPARVVKIPANFPPAASSVNPSLSGMGTPDLLGTYGTFQVITDNPELVDTSVAGGIIAPVSFEDERARAELTGPPNPLSAGGEAMKLAVDIVRDREAGAAMIRLGDVEVILTEDEWSGWVPVAFDPGLLGGPVGGIVRLYLADLEPRLRLYVSPINIDPLDPVMPISSPPGYAAAIARDIGRFYTQGMPADTKALAAGVLSDDEFLEQAYLVLSERERLLDRELAAYRGGLFFFYVSSIDMVSHMFWRSLEPDASAEDAAYAHVIPDLYARIDRLIGRVAAEIGDDVPLVVMSDHGFASYRKKVHLNTWLAQQGYLVLRQGEPGEGPLGHIDWTRTQAYALGLNQLFINRSGRERNGVVDAAGAAVLRDQIARKLKMLRDPETGGRVVTDVIDVAAEGPIDAFSDRAPDLLVGFNRGYRSSDESAIGAVGDVVLEQNRDKWSGDHCMDSRLVPGILVTSFELPGGARPTLADLAPTVLEYFSVDIPKTIAGRSFLSQEETR